MSTKSKTANKLVSSIRKSKTGAVAKKTSERPDATKSATRSKASASKSTPKTTPKTAAKKSSSATTANRDRQNPFSRGRRVWPD